MHHLSPFELVQGVYDFGVADNVSLTGVQHNSISGGIASMPGQLCLMANSIYHRSTRSGQAGLILGMVAIVVLLIGVIICSIREFTVSDKATSWRRRLFGTAMEETTSSPAVFEETGAVRQSRASSLWPEPMPLLPRVSGPAERQYQLEKHSSTEGCLKATTGTDHVFYKVHRTSREGRKPERYSVLVEAPIGVPLAYAEVMHSDGGALDRGHARILRIVGQNRDSNRQANRASSRTVEVNAVIKVEPGGNVLTVKMPVTGSTVMQFKAENGPDGLQVRSANGPGGEEFAKIDKHEGVTNFFVASGADPGMILLCALVSMLLVSPGPDGL